MARVNRKVAKYHPNRVQKKIQIGLALLWLCMVGVGVVAIDMAHNGHDRAVDAIGATFGVPKEVATDFVERGGIGAALTGDLESFLETKDGIGYDAEEKLVEQYGWTRQQILDNYPTTAWKRPARRLMDKAGL